jgi:hypothetical protein
LNNPILNIDIQDFINSNLKSDVSSILLKGISFSEVETIDIIEQIEAKKRCEKKLPSWFQTKQIIYPNKLNIEQTSSEVTAKYKSELLNGESIIDLTGGFGVDCFYFSKHFKKVTHCEINEALSGIVKHNNKQIGIDNILTIASDGINYLKLTNKKYDWIYIDPSRRHNSKGKVFFLKDCLPNVPEHLDLLFQHSNNILIKTSPLLDISIGINELEHVKNIHIVAVKNEVKELLWILEKGFKGDIIINTVNLINDNQFIFKTSVDTEKKSDSKYHLPLSYLYEPNAAILKAGAFNSISKKLAVYKLHKHSHLYTSNNRIQFPGRCFKIENVIHYNKKAIKKLGISQANITTRNFPETVKDIRKKFKIKDGSSMYLFFTTDMNADKILIIASKNSL